MWVIAGVLLGLVLLASLLGFHVGPHVHAVAGVLGVLAAGWLLLMVAEGRSLPVLWVLLSADVVVSAGVGVLAWKGLTERGSTALGHRLLSSEGAEGVALGELDPEGLVRVNGEDWSAVSLNGHIRAGSRVQVIRGGRVRLEVWGDEVEPREDGPALGAALGAPAADDPKPPGPAPARFENERHRP